MKKSSVICMAFAICGAFAFSACQTTVGDNRDDIKAPLVEPLVGGTQDEADIFMPPTKTPITVPVDPVSKQDIVIAPVEKPQIKPYVPAAPKPIKYVVKQGDNPYLIAEMYGVRVGDLLSYNKIANAKRLMVGATLTIPPGGAFVPPEKRPKHTSPKKVVKKTTIEKTKSQPTVKTTETVVSVSADGKEYVVIAGDFPAKIAKKLGCKTAELLAVNGLTEKSVLQIGQKMKVPGTATQETTTVVETTTIPGTVPAGTSVTTPSADIPAGTVTPEAVVTDPTLGADPVVANDAMEAEEGETLRKISAMFSFDLNELIKLNPNLPPDQPLKKGTPVKTPSY